MNILIVSWFFPPANAIGAVRVGRLAEYLADQGHEVRVISGRNNELAATLPMKFPGSQTRYARWNDINWLPRTVQTLRKKLLSQPTGTGGIAEPNAGAGGFWRGLSNWYVDWTNFPDRHVGWIPWAYFGAMRDCRDWKPNLILASGPPFASFYIANALSRTLGVPWFAEFRDRWVDDPYASFSPARQRRLTALEARLISTARGVITVTPPWAEFYRRKFGKPVAVVFNGYDEADFPQMDISSPPAQAEPLTIAHMGSIYPGRRDPSPLFEALALLGPERQGYRIVFYGASASQVLTAADRYGVRDVVESHGPVPYAQSIELQRRADVLLLLQWNDPREQGNCPAKLFEYLAVLRPILGIGLDSGVPASIIRSRNAGLFSNQPSEIAAQLRAWRREKTATGLVSALPRAAREGLSRKVQFETLEKFLQAHIL